MKAFMSVEAKRAINKTIKDYATQRDASREATREALAARKRVSNLRKHVYVALREYGYSYGTVRRMVAEAKAWI